MSREKTGIIAYGASTKRPKPELELHAPHPYGATITLTALTLAGYEGIQWEVATSWLGPPLPGAPPSQIPVAANDVIMLDDEQLARVVARRARTSLASGEIPDLFVLSGQPRQAPG